MNNTLLFHIETLMKLRAKSWKLGQDEDDCIRDMQYIIQEQAKVEDEIFRWEAEIQRIRNLDRAEAKKGKVDSYWSKIKHIADLC